MAGPLALLLALAGGDVLDVRVVDDAGNPVGGAAVLVVPAAEGQVEPPSAFTPPAKPRPGDPGDRAPVWKRTDRRADAEGRIRVEGLAAGDHWVLASLEGMREGWVRARPGTEAVVRVPGPRSIAGTCVDAETGAPVKGLPVWYGAAIRGGWVTLLQKPTDEQGRFRIDGLLPGEWSLNVGNSPRRDPDEKDERGFSDAYLVARLEKVRAGSTDLVIQMRRGLEISGRVVDENGEPAKGIHVEVVSQSATGGELMGRDRSAILAGPDGRFVVRGLPEGVYGIRVGRETDRAGWIDSFDKGSAAEKEARSRYTGKRVDRVPAGTKDLEIRVNRVATISGTTVDAEGKPFRPGEEFPLYVVRASGPFAGSALGLEGKLEPEGDFSTAPLEPGALYDICVFLAQGKGSGAARGVRAGTSAVRIVMNRGRDISGVVVDEEGKPVGPGVPVRALATGIQDGQFGGYRTTTTGEGGAFHLERLADISVTLCAGGGESEFVETVDPHEFLPGEAGVRIAARRGVAVQGRLVDKAGRPVRATWVAADAGATLPCGEDGSFRIVVPSAGKVRLSAWIRGREVGLGEVEAPGAVVEVVAPGADGR